jgi:hypothetical protein
LILPADIPAGGHAAGSLVFSFGKRMLRVAAPSNCI